MTVETRPDDAKTTTASAPSEAAPASSGFKPRRVQIGVSDKRHVAPPMPPAPSPATASAKPKPKPESGDRRRDDDDDDESSAQGSSKAAAAKSAGGGFAMPDSEGEEQVSRALAQAMDSLGVTNPSLVDKRPLKKQWDDELEQELQEMMEGFDPKAFDSNARNRGALNRSLKDQQAPASASTSADSSKKGREAPSDKSAPEPSRRFRLAKVIAVRGDNVYVDMGGKSDGLLPASQFEETGQDLPEPGSLIEVLFDHHDISEGISHVNLKGATVEATWESLRQGTIVEARVTKVNKGGLDVDVSGIRGFLPISQIDLNRVEDAAVYMNERLRVVVTEANERAGNLVVSRKELLIQEREEQKVKTWAELEEGQVRKGLVRSVKDYGAFVDLGGVDGLLHVADMSWSRLKDVYGFMKMGQEIEVKILKIDRETKKISLGLKQLLKSPWDDVEEKYPVGKILKGVVTRVQEFGAFVELESGIDGLIHISELSRQKIRKVSDAVKVDQEVDVQVIKVEPEIKRIGLSIRQAEETKARAADAVALAEMQAAAKVAALEAAESAANAPPAEPASASDVVTSAVPAEEPAKPGKSKPQAPLKGGLRSGSGSGGLFG